MKTVDELVAEAKEGLRQWEEATIAAIRANHNRDMAVIRERARQDMENGLAIALSTYRQSLVRIQQMREEHRKLNPEIADRMEKVYERDALSAKRAYESSVSMIKDMYRKGFGI